MAKIKIKPRMVDVSPPKSTIASQIEGSKVLESDLHPSALTWEDRNKASEALRLDLAYNRIDGRQKEFAEKDLTKTDFYVNRMEKAVSIAEQYEGMEHGSESIDLTKDELRGDIPDYEGRLERVWKNKNYSQEAKQSFTEKLAKTAARYDRIKKQDAYEEVKKHIDAQKRDNENKFYGNTFQMMTNSLAQGMELLISPARLAIQGEEEGMAYQEAARLTGYHETETTADKYLHLALQNAAPMGATLAAAMVPGVGIPLSAAVIASHTGTDSYYDMKRRGMDTDSAAMAATAVGLSTAAVEMLAGKALSKTPGIGRLISDPSRHARLRSLTNAVGKSGKTKDLLKAIRSGNIRTSETAKALKGVFTDTSRLKAAGRMLHDAGSEGFVGGFEEFIQEGLTMGLTEAALQADGLEGVMPRREDGTIDTGEVMRVMKDAFVAGMVLEGFYGGAAMTFNAKGAWENGRMMEEARQHIKDEGGIIAYDPAKRTAYELFGMSEEQINQAAESGVIAVNGKDFTNEMADYIARRTALETGVEIDSAIKANGGKEIGMKKRQEIARKARESAIQEYFADPWEAALVELGGNATVDEFVPGKALSMTINGQKRVLVKAEKPLTDADGNEVAVQYQKDPGGADSIKVSNDVWSKLKEKGLTKDVVSLSHYIGAGLPHDFMHVIVNSAPASVGEQVMGIYDNPVQAEKETQAAKDVLAERVEAGELTQEQADAQEAEINKNIGLRRQEAPAEAVEQEMKRRSTTGVERAKHKAADVYAALDVAIRGKDASEFSKKRQLERNVVDAVFKGRDFSMKQFGNEATFATKTAGKVGKFTSRAVSKARQKAADWTKPKQADESTTQEYEGEIPKSPIVDTYGDTDAVPGPEGARNYDVLNQPMKNKKVQRPQVNQLSPKEAQKLFNHDFKRFRERINTRAAEYAEQNNLSDAERKRHEDFLRNKFFDAINRVEIFSEQNRRPEESDLYRIHNDLLVKMKPAAARLKPIADKALQDGNIFYEAELNYGVEQLETMFKEGGNPQWTEADAQAMKDFLTRIAEGSLGIKQAANEHQGIIAARQQLNSLTDAMNVVSDAVQESNIDIMESIGSSQIESKREIRDDVGATRDYAQRTASGSDSLRLKGKKIGSNARITSISQAGQTNAQYFNNVLLPLTEDAYFNIFSGLDIDSSFIENRSTTDKDGNVDVLRVGSMEFDLDNYTDRQRIDQLTELFGPMWAVASEAARLQSLSDTSTEFGNTALQLSEKIHTMERLIREGKYDYDPEGKAARSKQELNRAHFPTFLTQDKPMKVPMPGSGAKISSFGNKKRYVWKKSYGKNKETLVDMAPRITTDALVKFFKKQGLESDGSPVDFADLAQQHVRNDQQQTMLEKSEIDTATEATDTETAKGDVNTGVSNYFDRAETQGVVDTTVSAEAAARETIRRIAELYTANMSDFELKQAFGNMSGAEGVASNQGAVADRTLNQYPPNATDLTGRIANFKYEETRQTIGEVLDDTLQKFKGRPSEGSKAVAMRNVSSLDMEQTTQLLDDLQTKGPQGDFLLDIDTKLNSPESARNLLKNLLRLEYDLSFDIDGASEAYVKKLDQYLAMDEDASLLQAAIDRVYAYIDKNQDITLNMSMKDRTLARVMSGLNGVEIQDQIFSLNNMLKMKSQIENVDLYNSFNRVFGIEPEGKMRDILKHLMTSVVGKKTSDGKTDWQARSTAQKYSVAMHFAVDAMNSADSNTELTEMTDSIQNTIKNLESKEKLTTEENYKLGTYKEYAAAMPLAQEIVNGEGRYGQKIQDWIKGEYAKQSDEFYDNVATKSRFVGDKEKYYSARVFVPDAGVETDTPDFMMSQISSRVLKRKMTLPQHLAEGRMFKYDDFLVNALQAQHNVIDAMTNQRMVDDNLSSGFFSTDKQAGYKLLKAPGAKKYMLQIKKDGRTVKGFADFAQAREAMSRDTSLRGGKVEPYYLDMYAPADFADYYNKITATSPLRKNKFWSGLMATNAKLKAIRINFGMFHRRGLLWSAMFGGTYNRSLAEKGQSDSINYGNRRKLGKGLMFLHNKDFYGLTHYGMTSFQIKDIGKASLQHKTKVEKFIRGGRRNQAAAVSDKLTRQIGDLTERLQGELFGIFGSSMKTATAFNELEALRMEHREQITKEKMESRKNGELAPHAKNYFEIFPDTKPEFSDFKSPTEEKIFRTVAGLANADFGGLHYERMGVSRGAQDAMRLLFLGPDWTASNFISAAKAMPFLGGTSGDTSGSGSLMAGTEMEKKVYKKFWLRIMGRSLGITLAINAVMAGLDDETALQRAAKAKKRGKFRWLMADISPAVHLLGGDKGTDHYLNVPGHFLDPAKWMADPVRSAYHKTSAVTKPALELFSGTRYDHKRPTKISNIKSKGLYTWENNRRGPLAPSELPSYALWQSLQTLPIQFRNVFDIFAGERNVITGTMQAGLGLDVARTYD